MSKRSFHRRDATGHLDPKYAADLRARSLESAPRDGEVAFVARAKSADPLVEALGEEFVAAATSGEEGSLEDLNRGVPEELGGPFVVTRARTEFARGTDRSNPKDATREPFPKTSADEPND
jgi:hypothetical protein